MPITDRRTTVDIEEGNGVDLVVGTWRAPDDVTSPVPQSNGDATKPYQELQSTQFDSIIAYLESQRMMAPCYNVKGKNGRYPKGNDGWFATLFTFGGRAFDLVFVPFLFVTINAFIWTAVNQLIPGFNPYAPNQAENWRSAFQLGLSTTLSFLLVFRLNRSILRFWEAMKAWGNIVYFSRSLVSAVLIHGRDSPYHRDKVVVWVAATAIAAKKALRQEELEIDDLGDILAKKDINAINAAYNSPLYTANEARYHLKQLFDVTKESGPLSPARSSEMRQHEKILDFIIQNNGMAENIINTPLPLCYVTHLRTYLMVYLLSLPYLTQHLWGWWTVPIVSMTGALMLGVEGASAEVESPFEKGKVNDLDLDNYCEIIMQDIRQLVKTHNAREKKLYEHCNKRHSK